MLSYDELLAENKRLRDENASLKAELRMYKRIDIDIAPAVNERISPDIISKFSSPQKKIALFKSLFCGREDVFARRWYSKTTEKSGYQPVCANEWDEQLCDKRKYKCNSCPNRKLLPLSDKDIFNHLSGKDLYGRDVVGIYPMLSDDTCKFCCVDFDDEGFAEAAKAFFSVCTDNNIPAYIERSRSGNGAHIWIFFSLPISAKKARTFASGILTNAMERCRKIDFTSYDRMFPNQDTVPNGGFGNLIALPLQGQARKNSNSVFVDSDFEEYDDQWAFLSGVIKIDESFVDSIISRLCKKKVLGNLMSDSESKPWITENKQLSAFDFPQSICITIANGLYIPINELSSKAVNSIKRLAAFKNPDFYRAQAMRMPVYNKPRIISLAEQVDDYIVLPRGSKNALEELLASANIDYSFDDRTNTGSEIDVSFKGTLRDEQQSAAEALLSNNIGVLSATTAFGKTVVGSYLIAQRKVNTLILVHTQALMNQWKESLLKFIDFNIEPPEEKKGRGRKPAWSPVGLLGAGRNTLHGYVDVAVMQSLVDGDEVKELVKNYGMIIVDECHHVSAVNFEMILKYADAKYVYGLTATPTRQDGHHPIIFMQCGEIRYKADAKAQAEKRDFEQYLVPKFTSFRKNYEQGTLITQIYSDLVQSELRNRKIAEDVISAVNSGRTPIILTERKEHAVKLKELLTGKSDNIILLTGNASQKEKRLAIEELKSVPKNESLIVIATGKYVGEGFDYPRLDTLFLALPIAWKGKVAQYAGRLHRDYPGKNEVLIYDYADIHIPVLERMYQKRLKGYSSIGYKIRFENKSEVSSDLIYDGKSFAPVFSSDISNVIKEIVIVSPFVRKSRLKNLNKLLSEAIEKGIVITVFTRPPEDFIGENKAAVDECSEMLRKMGITVKYKSNFHQKFTVIDSKTVWYGSVNFLSYGTAEESIMRFESGDVAGELLDTVM